jgi:hypothetical protein
MAVYLRPVAKREVEVEAEAEVERGEEEGEDVLDEVVPISLLVELSREIRRRRCEAGVGVEEVRAWGGGWSGVEDRVIRRGLQIVFSLSY